MGRHLEAVALAVAHADPRFIPGTIRWAYEAGAAVWQVITGIEVAQCLAPVPPATLSLAWQAAHDWGWLARRTKMA
jgi:hypothetical protein